MATLDSFGSALSGRPDDDCFLVVHGAGLGVDTPIVVESVDPATGEPDGKHRWEGRIIVADALNRHAVAKLRLVAEAGVAAGSVADGRISARVGVGNRPDPIIDFPIPGPDQFSGTVTTPPPPPPTPAKPIDIYN